MSGAQSLLAQPLLVIGLTPGVLPLACGLHRAGLGRRRLRPRCPSSSFQPCVLEAAHLLVQIRCYNVSVAALAASSAGNMCIPRNEGCATGLVRRGLCRWPVSGGRCIRALAACAGGEGWCNLARFFEPVPLQEGGGGSTSSYLAAMCATRNL